jgi:CRP/FNR family transcriptional regulator
VPDRVAFLISGSVRSVLTSGDGRQALTRLTLAPAVLGALEAWTGLASPVSVLAMEISQVAILPVDHFRRTVAQSPDLNRAWLLMLAEDQRFMFEQHRRVLFEGLQRRLAQLLLQLVHTYGLPVPGGRRVRIRLRHEDLADYLGAARRSVTRILTDWRVRGWVLHEAGSFTVARPEALVEIRGESTGQVTPLFGR